MKESSYLSGREELLPRMFALPSLAGFKEDHLRRIMSLSKVRSYEPGEYIIRQGQFDCWVYILIGGSARVERDGKEIGQLQRAGDLFGEMGVVTGEARSADVIATKPTACLAIDGSIFERKSDNEHIAFVALFYRLFAEVLSARLAETNEELTKVKAQLEALKHAGS
jgi:CRP/FNR family transcriptional regulator, cyclic AMP receptor protein